MVLKHVYYHGGIMRLFLIIYFLIGLFVSQQSPPCTVMQSRWNATHYAIKIPHDVVAQGLSYTAVPPVELITQHYITTTFVFTIPNTTPPITTTIRTFEYSETVDTLGYTPLVAHAPDYAYVMRSDIPFQSYACNAIIQPHTFIPLVHRTSIGAVMAWRPVD